VADQTTVLYVLTTLAQSCAALAAFVGAVGVFRIQMLREQRQSAEQNIRGLSHIPVGSRASLMPIGELTAILDQTRQDLKETTLNRDTIVAVLAVLDLWRAYVPRMKSMRTTLIVLEGWNLAAIAVALICFNYVAALAVAPWFSCVLVFVTVITALVPLGCVWVWTQGVEK